MRLYSKHRGSVVSLSNGKTVAFRDFQAELPDSDACLLLSEMPWNFSAKPFPDTIEVLELEELPFSEKPKKRRGSNRRQ